MQDIQGYVGQNAEKLFLFGFIPCTFKWLMFTE